MPEAAAPAAAADARREPFARRVALAYAAFASAWILLSDRAVAWLAPDATALAWASTLKGWVFIAVTALLLYVLLRRHEATGRQPLPTPAGERRLAWVVGLAIALATLAAGTLAVQRQRDAAVQALARTAELRATQVAAWAQSRLDAGALVREFDAAGLSGRLEALTVERGYLSASRLDEQRRVVWSTGPVPDPATDVALPDPEQPRLLGPQPDHEGVPHVDLLVPLRPAQGGGFALLRLGSADLPPLRLDRAGGDGQGIDSFLARRFGDTVVYFGSADTPRQRSAPADGSIVAVSAGWIVEGTGERGQPALGLVRPIAGTPWLLLTRVDGATLARQRWQALALVLLAATALGFGASVLLALRRQRQALERGDRVRRQQSERLDAVAVFEAIADSSPDTIFAKDLDGRYLLFNRAAERLTGHSRDEVIGRDDAALFPADVAEQLREEDRAAREGTRIYDERLPTVDGPREMTVTKGPLRGRDGELIGTFGISRDVSELHKERALLAETNRIARIGGWSFERAGRNVEWTEELRRLLGIAADVDADTGSALAFLDADSRRRWDQAVERMRGSGEPMDLELSLHTAQGRARWVRVVGYAEHDGERVVRAHGFVQDITEATELRLELEGYRRDLERQVRERTADLEVARARAEAGVKVKDAFIRIVSHELRTPLHQILNLAPALRLAGAGPGEPFLEAAGRLAEILEDVLTLSELEAGGVVAEAVPFELGDLVRQARDTFVGDARRKGLGVELDVPEQPTWLLGDPLLLARALGNYLRNALKFTARGGIRIVARADAEGPDRVRLTLAVEDTGPGIAAAQMPRLFAIFEPGDASVARRHGGAGLGLALTQRLARLLGGEVGVDSREGVGSRFWLRVPLARAPAGPGADDDAESALRRAHAGARVLVVDDNAVNLELARGLLEHAGLEVRTAAGGREAIRLALAEAPALLLIDLVMPNLDGRDAARELRRRGATMPILGFSAAADEMTPERCRECGLDGCIGKPVDPADLYRTLLRWLPAAPAAGGARASDAPASGSLQALPALPGVDAAAALAVARGDAARAAALLRLFSRSHRGDAPRLAAAARADERETLRRLAHALRGAAGNVGAVAVREAAERLERAARDDAPGGCVEAADALAAALESLADALQRLPAQPAAAPARPAGDVAQAVSGLALLLAAGDTACATHLAEHETELRAAMGARFDALAGCIDEFRFDEAAAMLHDHAAGPADAAPDNPAP